MPDALAIARALHIAACLSLFGVCLFRAALGPAALDGAPPAAAVRLTRYLAGLSLASWLMALITALAWLSLQAAAMSGTSIPSEVARATWIVLQQTLVGHVFLVRVVFLLAAGVCLWLGAMSPRAWPARVGAGLSGIGVILLAAVGHAVALEGADRAVLLFSLSLHLLAAGAWLGSLVPLMLTLAALPPSCAAVAAEWFSPLGVACVAVLAVSAWINAAILIDSVSGLLGTPYGHWALVKLALLAVLLGFAAVHRFKFTPALAARKTGPETARRMRVTVALEAGVGLAVVVVAAKLASTLPGIHSQPWWPLPFRFSAEAFRDDVSAPIAAVLALGGIALIVSRWRHRGGHWVFVPFGLALVAYAVPSFQRLIVAAYPTSFWRSPTGFSASSVVEGAALFAEHCAACHSAAGRDDGPVNPAAKRGDLTAVQRQTPADGDLFWWISRGIGGAMPGFADQLDETAIWNLVDFVQAKAAAPLAQNGGIWDRPVAAPDFTAACPNGAWTRLQDLRGRVVLLAFTGADAEARVHNLAAVEPQLRSAGVTPVIVEPAGEPIRSTTLCVAGSSEIVTAYAVVTGFSIQEMTGAEILIDGASWVRAVWRPGQPGPDWRNPSVLLARVRDIRRALLAPAHVH